ncbi:MAG: hypothetical protein HY717_23070 [Planctomycetes bacterium]|nr:hypothetical protein [Planctomycetota bacterium]
MSEEYGLVNNNGLNPLSILGSRIQDEKKAFYLYNKTLDTMKYHAKVQASIKKYEYSYQLQREKEANYKEISLARIAADKERDIARFQAVAGIAHAAFSNIQNPQVAKFNMLGAVAMTAMMFNTPTKPFRKVRYTHQNPNLFNLWKEVDEIEIS